MTGTGRHPLAPLPHLVQRFDSPLASVPTLVEREGKAATKRFLEFFAAHIRNPNTRAAYARGVGDFLTWSETAGIATLNDIEPLHIAAYVEGLTQDYAAPTVKQRLAGIRRESLR